MKQYFSFRITWGDQIKVSCYSEGEKKIKNRKAVEEKNIRWKYEDFFHSVFTQEGIYVPMSPKIIITRGKINK